MLGCLPPCDGLGNKTSVRCLQGFLTEVDAEGSDSAGHVPELSSARSGIEAEGLSLSQAGLVVPLLSILA